MKNVYFVLYGEFEFVWHSSSFGERIGLGWTIGEEVLFSKANPIKRLETVIAKSEACLLQIKVTDLENMAKPNKTQAAGSSFKPDYDTLMGFLVSNYETKQNWRKDVGIIIAAGAKSPRATKYGTTFRSVGTTTNSNFNPKQKHPKDSSIEFF